MKQSLPGLNQTAANGVDLAFDSEKFFHSFALQAMDDSTLWLRGVETYHQAETPPLPPSAPVLDVYGAAQVLDYQGPLAKDVPLIVVVPSLINRAHILDLLPERSFLRQLSKTYAVWLLDWGVAAEAEQKFSLDNYIVDILVPVLEDARRTGRPVVLLGYCMGGLLAKAAAVLRPDLVDKLVLLATPWDFSAYPLSTRLSLMQFSHSVWPWLATGQMLTIDHIQTLFALLQPFAVYDKFKKVGKDGCSALFVATEDWLNDGVPLPAAAATTCLYDWFQLNTPVKHEWHVAGAVINPAAVKCKTLVVVPMKDQVVPAAAAMPLGENIHGATLLQVPFGHIGMIIGEKSVTDVLNPLCDWIKHS